MNRSLAALTLVAAALPSALAAQAADPSKVVATVPDAADKAWLAEEVDAGHTRRRLAPCSTC